MRSSAAIKTFNTLLILLGLALIIISYPKLFIASESSEQVASPPIGKILEIKNDTRLKKSNLFNWNNSASGDKIHNNDWIFTNEKSEAVFELSKGQEVSVKSQTMLKLKDQSLEVKNGEVELSLNDPAKELIIVVGNREFSLRSSKKSKVTVSSGDGESRFQVSQGEIQIKAQNVDVTAKAGEEIRTVAGDASKAKSDVIPTHPVDKTIVLGPEETFSFQAQNAPEKSSVKVKSLSTGRAFDYPLGRPVAIAPGDYQWEVVLGSEGLSHPETFSVLKESSPPKLIAPKELEEIVFYEDSVKVDFFLKNELDFILQIVDEFDNMHFSETVSSNKKEVEFFKGGTYAWKAKSQTPQQESEWSPSRKLIVRKMDYTEGEPVVIELKRPNQLASFNWDGDTSAGASFKLSKTKDFKNIVHQENVTGKSSAMANIPEVGVYYWKIENSAGETVSAKPKKVLIRPTPPPIKPKAPPALKLKLRPKKRSASFFTIIQSAHAEEFEEVTVAFEAIEDAKAYEVEIYSDQNQKRLVKTIKTESPSFKWTPPRAGSYTWRIRYQDYWGRWSPFSEPSKMAALMDVRVKTKRKKRPIKKKRKPIQKRKVVKTAPKSDPKSLRKIKVKKAPLYTNSVAGFYAPAQIAYESKKSQAIQVDGATLGGHALEYRKGGNWPALLSYRSNYGKVFGDQSFASRSIEAGMGKDFGFAQIGVSGLMLNTSDYQIGATSVEEADAINAFGIGVFAHASFGIGLTNPLLLEASIHTLQATQFALSIGYDFNLNKRFSLETKLRAVDFSTESDDGGMLNSQSVQALFGPKYLF